MEHSEIVKAIQHIRPGAEFVLHGEELEWRSEQSIPTQKEIADGWIAYQIKVESDKAEAKAKREALLERLGITDDEAKLLAQSL